MLFRNIKRSNRIDTGQKELNRINSKNGIGKRMTLHSAKWRGWRFPNANWG